MTTTTFAPTSDGTDYLDTVKFTRELVMTAALKFERPRAYVSSLVIAFHYDPDTRLSHVSTKVMAEAAGRSERHSVRYKGQRLAMWDLVEAGSTGNTYKLNEGTVERLAAKATMWSAALGEVKAQFLGDMLGDGSWWSNSERLGVDVLSEDDYGYMSPAARVRQAGVVGGPLMALFVASLQHRSQTDAFLLGSLLWGLDATTGVSKVNRKALMSALGLGHEKSVDRKVRLLVSRTDLLVAERTDDGWLVYPSEKFCVGWSAWSGR